MLEISLDLILPNPEQPRQSFDPAAMQELADSIRANGVIQPVIVEASGDHYILHDGERRVRAARLAGLVAVPAVVVPPLNGAGPHDRLVRAIVANVQRRDLSPMEEARAYGILRDREGLTQSQIAARIGVQMMTVHNRLLLLDLDPELQALIESGGLSPDPRLARALRAIPDRQARLGLASKIASNHTSIKAAVAAADHVAEQAASRPAVDRVLNETPAVRHGLSHARHSLSIPAWDALAQVGRLVPWSIVEQSSRAVCNDCSLRSMAGDGTCRHCPLPLALSKMVDSAMQAASSSPRRSTVPLSRKPVQP